MWGTQYDIDDKDEDEGEELKEDNNVNDQIIKCHNFLKSQDRDLGFSWGPQYDDGDEDEDEEVKEDNNNNEEVEEKMRRRTMIKWSSVFPFHNHKLKPN